MWPATHSEASAEGCFEPQRANGLGIVLFSGRLACSSALVLAEWLPEKELVTLAVGCCPGRFDLQVG